MVRVLLLSLLVLSAVWSPVWAPRAEAQIGLPSVRLPAVSLPSLTGGLDKTVSAAVNDLNPDRLQDLRKLQVRDLLRRYPKVIEADPNGAPVIRGEVLVFSPSDAVLEAARQAGFQVVRERPLEGLDARIVVLRAPEGTSTRKALERLRALDPSGSYDFNHLYTPSGTVSTASATASAGVAPSGATVTVGLIDSGVDAAHPVFRGVAIHRHGCPAGQVPGPHGTAVASLMVGRSERFHGAAPGSELYAADVFCGLPTGGAVDAVADAFGWLVHERVPVINVSLVGPANAMLESVVRMVIARGHIVVAAVGNDGAAAPPLYPAAYPDVVGVTAVDARRRVLVEAERGKQVKFAAPGADMSAASPHQTYAMVRGTSFASPIVAGLLAAEMAGPDKGAAERAIADLARRAVDLGAPGLDPVYGYGLVGADLRPEPALARVRAE